MVWNRLDATADGGDWEIWLYDIAAAASRRITDDLVDGQNPLIDDGHVVRQREVAFDADVMVCDIATYETLSVPAEDAVEERDLRVATSRPSS